MRRTVVSFLLVLFTTGLTFAGVPMGDWGAVIPPGIDATGGPDAYGYTWIDSNEPGGPVYAWKDITTTGTLVTGLGDDNYVGPFPIGFPFHYYWYDVTQYWIGSNGYIKFGTPYNMAQPFPTTIPLAGAPNDFLAVYVADWYPGVPSGTGLVYRWNNADSCVVSFINVHPWVGPGVIDGPHTFQVIMSRLDSSISFQYDTQVGTVSNNDILIGIENANGQVGLLHSFDSYPPSNYKVYFDYPATTSYVAHDMASIAAANPNSEGFFVIAGTAVTPWGRVKNVGNQLENTFQVNCTIQQVGGGVVYNQTVTQGPLAAGAELDVTFSPNWTPATTGQYLTKITVTLTGDQNPSNDLKQTETRVITLPGDLLYDDGTSEQGWSWIGGNGGLGQHFVPPVYPVQIDTIKFFCTGTGTSPFTAQILDDDGPNGTPGTVLFSQNVTTPTSATWYRVGVTPPVVIQNGGFYLSWQMVDTLTMPLGTDNTDNIGSRQAWEYTGVWSTFRNLETSDPMIRAKISQPGVAPNVTITMTPINPPIQIPAIGGSFNFNVGVNNGESSVQTFAAWIMVQLPNGSWYGPVLGPINLTLPGGASITRQRTQTIPGSAPAGVYLYQGRVGVYPNTIWNSSGFNFTKLSTGDGAYVPDWNNYGQGFDAWMDRNDAEIPSEFTLTGAHPNPFNPSTTISFSLPEASQITMSVYDLSGRVVATLNSSWLEAGSHEIVFDGSNLSSGVYLYRLNAGTHNAVGKMVLMK